MNESKGAEYSIGPISVVVNTVERAVEGGQEFTVFKVRLAFSQQTSVISDRNRHSWRGAQLVG